MADRKQVLKALRACSPGDTIWCQMREKGECDYAGAYCMVQLLRDAAELLTPRILTLSEIPEHDGAVFIEYKRGDEDWALYVYEDGPFFKFNMVACGGVMLPLEDYGIEWRAWTGRPTPEQRWQS